MQQFTGTGCTGVLWFHRSSRSSTTLMTRSTSTPSSLHALHEVSALQMSTCSLCYELTALVALHYLSQGFRAPWKVLEFLLEHFQDLESPGNLLASSWKVLELASQWRGWHFLSSNRHVSANENSHNCCHLVHFLGCRYAKNDGWGSAPHPAGELTDPHLLFIAIFKHWWLIMGSWENATAVVERPGILCDQECGDPDITS